MKIREFPIKSFFWDIRYNNTERCSFVLILLLFGLCFYCISISYDVCTAYDDMAWASSNRTVNLLIIYEHLSVYETLGLVRETMKHMDIEFQEFCMVAGLTGLLAGLEARDPMHGGRVGFLPLRAGVGSFGPSSQCVYVLLF